MLHAQRNAPHESFDSLHHAPRATYKLEVQHASPWLCEKKQLSDEYAVFTATGITKRVKLLHITTAETKIRLGKLACTKKRPTWIFHSLHHAPRATYKLEVQHASPWLCEKKQLSDEYAVFTATGITKRVKLLHITTAEKKIRLDNLHARRNAPHESFDSLHHAPRATYKLKVQHASPWLCEKKQLSDEYTVFTATGITKRVKLLHITTAEKRSD